MPAVVSFALSRQREKEKEAKCNRPALKGRGRIFYATAWLGWDVRMSRTIGITRVP
jgi:hypothetical protein